MQNAGVMALPLNGKPVLAGLNQKLQYAYLPIFSHLERLSMPPLPNSITLCFFWLVGLKIAFL